MSRKVTDSSHAPNETQTLDHDCGSNPVVRMTRKVLSRMSASYGLSRRPASSIADDSRTRPWGPSFLFLREGLCEIQDLQVHDMPEEASERGSTSPERIVC